MLTQEQIAELELKHPGCVHIVDTRKRFEFVIRPPTPAEYKRWRQAVGTDSLKHAATENLMRAACVYPDIPGMEAILERFPGAFDSEGAQRAAKALLGLESDERGKD